VAITAALIALGLAQPSIALPGLAPSTPAKAGKVKHDPCLGHDTTAKQAGPFIEKVWDKSRWDRKPKGQPKPSTMQAWRAKLRCAAGPGHRRAAKHAWRRAQRAFYAHRRAELWRVRVTPFPGPGGTWWSTPYPLVVCESGADYGKPYGAYSILDPAWADWGGRTAHAGEASKKEQDRVAAVGWAMYGDGAWECKSDGSIGSF
jgi:hypothetical protein